MSCEEKHIDSGDLDSITLTQETPKSEKASVKYVGAFYFASFCWYATFFRYTTLYFESDGLTASQIGALWAVYRVIGTFTTPLWAALADKTKKARSICLTSQIASLPCFLCLAIPISGSSSKKMLLRAVSFWIFSLSMSPQNSLRDALAIAASENDVELWGRGRVWGAVGWGLMHLLIGPIMDAVGFSVLFVCFVIFNCVLYLVTRSSVPEACGEVRREVSTSAVMDIFLRNRTFFVNIAAIGAGFSMVEGMLFLLLQELDASTLLCGLSVVVTVIFELPIFHYAKPIMARLGTRRMILLGQFAWVVRAIFYANLRIAWTVLLIEPLHGVTFALVWTAATQHVADPSVAGGAGLEASAQGLLQVCFMGIGPVVGLFVGGLLFENIGSHTVYAVFAAAIVGSGVVYARWGGSEAQSYGTAVGAPSTKPSAIGVCSTSLGEENTVLDTIAGYDCQEPATEADRRHYDIQHQMSEQTVTELS